MDEHEAFDEDQPAPTPADLEDAGDAGDAGDAEIPEDFDHDALDGPESSDTTLTAQDWDWEPTGHPKVDEVLTGLEGLDDDVHSHVGAFEEAHRSLRQILDGAGAEAAADDAVEAADG